MKEKKPAMISAQTNLFKGSFFSPGWAVALKFSGGRWGTNRPTRMMTTMANTGYSSRANLQLTAAT